MGFVSQYLSHVDVTESVGVSETRRELEAIPLYDSSPDFRSDADQGYSFIIPIPCA